MMRDMILKLKMMERRIFEKGLKILYVKESYVGTRGIKNRFETEGKN